MNINHLIKIITAIAVTVIMPSCGTIMHGTTQQVGIGSSPSGANVAINNQSFGKTPTIADLKRGENHIVKIQMAGYAPYETTITKSVSGWVWGNIVFGGLIGLAVDGISGGIYKLTPEQIQANLNKGGNASIQLNKDSVYVYATLEPDPSWEKIGQLAKAQ